MTRSSERYGDRRTWAVIAVLVVLHLLFGAQADVGGAAVGFLTCATCVVSVTCGRLEATVAGFLLGLLFDLTGSGPIGLSPLLGCVMAYVLSGVLWNGLADGWQAPSAACCLALLACNLAYPLFLLAFGSGIELGWALVSRVLIGTAVDAVMCILCLWVLARRRGTRASSGMRLG